MCERGGTVGVWVGGRTRFAPCARRLCWVGCGERLMEKGEMVMVMICVGGVLCCAYVGETEEVGWGKEERGDKWRLGVGGRLQKRCNCTCCSFIQ